MKQGFLKSKKDPLNSVDFKEIPKNSKEQKEIWEIDLNSVVINSWVVCFNVLKEK